MNYEAIFVDWGGTLSNSRFWERWKDDPEYSERYARIQSALFESAAGKSLVRDWMTGFKNRNHALTYLNEHEGLPVDELEDELRYSAQNMKLIEPDVLSTIRSLRDMGKMVVIATDNMDTFSDWTVPALKLDEHFDDILTSSSLRVTKTTMSSMYNRSTFFYGYLNEMGIAPENSLLIDDSLDVKCVQSTGMDFLHVTDLQPLSHHLEAIMNERSV